MSHTHNRSTTSIPLFIYMNPSAFTIAGLFCLNPIYPCMSFQPILVSIETMTAEKHMKRTRVINDVMRLYEKWVAKD